MLPISAEQRTQLIDAARVARERAYAPYSHYSVGAALLTGNGTIVTGGNVENSAFPATICAERSAVVKAISDGMQDFVAVAVYTSDGAWPCGTCRQVLNEFAPHIQVIVADAAGNVYEEPLDALLPHGFILTVK
jgi:cytidine deaminase